MKITLPQEKEMLTRLGSLSEEPHLRDQLFPMIAEKIAGETRTPQGVVNAIIVSLTCFVRGVEDDGLWAALLSSVPDYIEALIDDADARTAALEFWSRAQSRD